MDSSTQVFEKVRTYAELPGRRICCSATITMMPSNVPSIPFQRIYAHSLKGALAVATVLLKKRYGIVKYHKYKSIDDDGGGSIHIGPSAIGNDIAVLKIIPFTGSQDAMNQVRDLAPVLC